MKRFIHPHIKLLALALLPAALILAPQKNSLAQSFKEKKQSNQSLHEEFVATVGKDGRVGKRSI